MIVDVHTHLWERPEQLGPALGARISQRLARRPWERISVTPQALADAMEPVQAAFILGFVSRRLEADVPARSIARFVEDDPSKYVGFAGVDPTADDWRDRLQEVLSLKLAGVVLSPAAQGFHPTHSRAMRVYEFCVEHKLPVVIDAASCPLPLSIMEFGQPHLLDEVGRDFPALRLVIGQVGHPWTDPTLSLIAKHANFYTDVSSLSARPWQLYQVLQAAAQQDVIHRLLLGSGFPFARPEDVMASLYHINGMVRGTLMPSIPRQDLKALVHRDAFECLGIARPAGQPPVSTAPKADAESIQHTSPADALLHQGLIPEGENAASAAPSPKDAPAKTHG